MRQKLKTLRGKVDDAKNANMFEKARLAEEAVSGAVELIAELVQRIEVLEHGKAGKQ